MKKFKEWADNNLQGDPVIWAVVFALSLISILVVYSSIGTLAYKRTVAPEMYLVKHTFMVLLGLGAMWIGHKIDYRYYSKLSRLALWVSVPLLVYTFTNGTSINDAARWITLPIINTSFQPSDFASLALIINLASMLSKKQQNIEDIKDSLIPMLIWCGVICGLIALTNLSTAILLFATCMLVMFIGRVPVKHMALIGLIAAGGFGVLLLLAKTSPGLLPRLDTWVARIENFTSDEVDSDANYQVEHAKIAIASGGLLPNGPGTGTSRNYLPHPYSDMIYAFIVEEYGSILGGLGMLLLYLILMFRAIRIANKCEKPFGALVSMGLGLSLVVQALVNMAVAVNLVPVTGQPLPLVSMGGTSIWFTCLAIGIILSVSRSIYDTQAPPKPEKRPRTTPLEDGPEPALA